MSPAVVDQSEKWTSGTAEAILFPQQNLLISKGCSDCVSHPSNDSYVDSEMPQRAAGASPKTGNYFHFCTSQWVFLKTQEISDFQRFALQRRKHLQVPRLYILKHYLYLKEII